MMAHFDTTKPAALVAQAIHEMYGEACEDFDAGCAACRAWKWFREASAARKQLEGRG